MSVSKDIHCFVYLKIRNQRTSSLGVEGSTNKKKCQIKNTFTLLSFNAQRKSSILLAPTIIEK